MSDETLSVMQQRTKVYAALDRVRAAADDLANQAMALRIAKQGDTTIQNDVDERLAMSGLALAGIVVQACELSTQARTKVLSFPTKAGLQRYLQGVKKTSAYRELSIDGDVKKLVAMADTKI